MDRNPSLFGPLNRLAKIKPEPTCGRILCSYTKYSNKHILSLEYQNHEPQISKSCVSKAHIHLHIEGFKSPYSSTHWGLQLLWRAPGQKKSFSIRKSWCKLKDEFYLLIWWETNSLKILSLRRNLMGFREIYLQP